MASNGYLKNIKMSTFDQIQFKEFLEDEIKVLDDKMLLTATEHIFDPKLRDEYLCLYGAKRYITELLERIQ